MRFPSIPVVAKAVRTLSANLPGETPVQLLIQHDGQWELVPGHLRVNGIHDRCWHGQAVVPGRNKQGRPRRFRSEDVARDLLSQARLSRDTNAPAVKAARTRMARGSSSPVQAPHTFEIGALVAFYGQVGRVVGHATIEATTGPMRVHLVECNPAFVPAWNLNLSIVPVADEALAPWIPPEQMSVRDTQPGGFVNWARTARG